MKVLVLGCYYSLNLGDGVICETVADQIRKAFPQAEVEIYDLWDRSSFDESKKTVADFKVTNRKLISSCLRAGLYRFVTKCIHWDVQFISVQRRLQESLKQLDRICDMECDFVVVAGGQLFMDSYALRLWYVIKNLEKKGVPVIINACGIGPTYSKKLQKYLSEAMTASNVVKISCRDDVLRASEYCISQRKCVEETFDPALGCAEVYGISQNSNAQTVGLGIMWCSRIPPFRALRFWKELILELEKKGIPWKIFVNGEKIDISFARKVVESLPGIKRNLEEVIVPIPSTPEDLVKTISQFKSIISFRLHSHIIATSLNVPSVAVVWDDKVRFFFRKIGYPERCCTLRNSPQEVLEKLQTAERKGYDLTVIESQKNYSNKWLMTAIESINKV